MRISILFWILVNSQRSDAQNVRSPVRYTFYFLGDAGAYYVPDLPIGDVLHRQIKKENSPSTVLYLGDNVYPKGLPERDAPSRATSEMILHTQVNWIKGLDAKGIFIPGNHDWNMWGKQGLQYVRYQEQWIDSLNDENFTFLPQQGCPGPVEIPINDKLLLVILDSQWFLHQWEKPAKGICQAETLDQAMSLLSDIFQRNRNKRIVIAAHHPLITYGEHGGVFPWQSHIFPLVTVNSKLYIPLPIIGSIYVFYRKLFPNIQDIGHRKYKKFIAVLQPLLENYPGTVYVAGHEHTLQYSMKDSVHYIGSGAGSKLTPVRKRGFAKFTKSVFGFVRLSQHEDGEVSIHYIEADGSVPEGKEIFTTYLEIP